MTTRIEINTSKSILGMSEQEKDAFIDIMDLVYDYSMTGDITDNDIALYKAILQERYDRARGETYSKYNDNNRFATSMCCGNSGNNVNIWTIERMIG